MEGKFVTKSQRVKLQDEIRKAHFTFGNDYEKIEKPKTSVQFVQNHSVTAQANQGSNLVLGKDPIQYESEHQQRYKKYQIGSQEQINKEKLQRHNFRFGNSSEKAISTTRQAFSPQQNQQNKQTISTAQLQQHSVSLGRDNPNFKSTNQQYFNQKHIEANNSRKEQAERLRKSNIVTGNHPSEFKSNSQLSYQSYDVNPANTYLNQSQSHSVVLGNQKNSYETTKRIVDKYVSQSAKEIPKKCLLDLQKSHFKFGDDLTPPQSHYNSYHTGQQVIHPAKINQQLQRTHFNFGNRKPDFKSSYNLNYPQLELTQQKQYLNNQSNQKSNIQIGKGEMLYKKSQSAEAFSEKKIQNIESDKQLVNFLRKGYVHMGPFKFQQHTTNKQYGQQVHSYRTPEKLPNQNQKVNFAYGYQQNEIPIKSNFTPNIFNRKNPPQLPKNSQIIFGTDKKN